MLPKFDALIEKLLLEYSDDTIVVRGEYWFDEHGNAQYADGDMGGMGHEDYVILRCGNEVLNYFNLEFDGDFHGDLSSKEDEIISVIKNKVGDSCGDIEDDPASAIIKYLVTFYKMPEQKADELVLTAYGSRGDAREYAIKNWNWIRVHGPNIEVNKLNTETLKKVAEGIRDALEQEGEMYEDDSYEKADRGVYNISTYTGKRYSITLDDMERGNVSGLETAMPEKSAAGQQLRQQDIKSMPSFYQKKGVIGDSVGR
jgi:hypothetical protein